MQQLAANYEVTYHEFKGNKKSIEQKDSSNTFRRNVSVDVTRHPVSVHTITYSMLFGACRESLCTGSGY